MPLDSRCSAGSSLRLVDVAVAVVVALAVVLGLVVQFPWESQVGFIVEHLEIPRRLSLVKERFEPVIVIPGVAGLLVVLFFLVLFVVEPVFWMSVAFLVVPFFSNYKYLYNKFRDYLGPLTINVSGF